jgi:hypothetical protein
MAESIADYGATADDGTDDTDAIWNAMDAAGDYGTVYVPEGTYRIGGGGEQFPFRIGSRQPKGISLTGDGPGKSVIKFIDGHDDWYRGIRYMDGYDHGAVTIDNMTWDGNWQNINTTSTGFGFRFQGTGSTSFEVTNVHWKGWWTLGGIVEVGDTTFRNCTFTEFGMGADSVNGSADGHGFNASAPDGEILAEDCLFEKGSGVAIDHDGTGDVRMRRCYVSNVGVSIMKNTPDTGTKYLEHVNGEDLSGSWIQSNLVDGLDTRGVYNVPPHNNGGPVVMNNVRIHNSTWPGLLAESPFDISGDLIVLENTNTKGDQAATWDVADGGYHDIGRLSIVDTEQGAAFYIRGGAGGSIAELNRQKNSGGLGDTGGVTVQSDNPGAAPHAVDVPSRSEVGAGVSSDSTSDSTNDTTNDTTTSHDYGGYEQPPEGTLDWHVPVNDNFQSIEKDVLALHERVKALEDSK